MFFLQREQKPPTGRFGFADLKPSEAALPSTFWIKAHCDGNSVTSNGQLDMPADREHAAEQSLASNYRSDRPGCSCAYGSVERWGRGEPGGVKVKGVTCCIKLILPDKGLTDGELRELSYVWILLAAGRASSGGSTGFVLGAFVFRYNGNWVFSLGRSQEHMTYRDPYKLSFHCVSFYVWNHITFWSFMCFLFIYIYLLQMY